MSASVAPAFAAQTLDRLRALTGDPSAEFRDGQLEAIHDVVADRARVLCVQRTGWGKSAVYFLATSLLRAKGAGPTLIVSPLLALMRNQIAGAERLGLRAFTINSTNRDEWDAIRAGLAADEIDLLLISPERLNNPRFRDEMLPLFAASVGLLVIDEAHCISDWGHDFRPDYRRVKDMLAALPERVAVLGTTATANDRVVRDVLDQLGAGARADEPLRSYRGPLGRGSLRLEALELPRPAERLAWLVEHLPQLPGSGIVYTLTKRDADQVASFLTANGIPALAYSGEQQTEDRIAAEERLLRNDVKALVATSALGMGYDKADLEFVVHYQAPGSVVSYYQQVGRAGRGVDHAEVILLRGTEDRRIQDFFIEQAFPAQEKVQTVLAELRGAAMAGEGCTSRELMAVVNLGAGRIEAMLKILDVEGAVRRDGTRWTAVEGSDWRYDGERYAQITALRRAEQEAMASFGTDGRCLMRALQEELDDPEPQDCGRCSVCAGPRFAQPPDARLVEHAQRHLRSKPLVLEQRKMAPDPGGTMRKIPVDALIEPGWALARLGDGGWWPAVERGLRAGRFDDEIAVALADALRGGGAGTPAWVTSVPSVANGAAVDALAEQLARQLGVPRLHLLERREQRPPQREMANAAQQAANVRGAFAVVQEPLPGAGVLLDDRRLSGFTLAMVGGQLRKAGAERIVPLALATLN
ncbi:RecQ family ATP-dependent DNA helicase [Conexibacter woesei]|uniref:DNA 3'-5' helicase n=1 Tax=Conexibacter woesei (strain DSM 14684 / CCUG 47730 / CIP 108061 / JCM 11494 / NBRC 100937 / ID131577) TaxID=469383 RepID=D3F678_CONWI|nr:RecQ family ATP-dependent DNA helicase [Conexibacter woesei]ADB48751.1 ATP-dependent DNA helicase, RecQ family [Conexibacter woesei DSM 14684]